MTDTVPQLAESSPTSGLLTTLSGLDQLLTEALELARVSYGQEETLDPFRGLYVGPADINRLLARSPGVPFLHVGTYSAGVSAPLDMVLTWLDHAFQLSALDLGAIVLALAPELDLRYERIYAYLQDDVTRRRPSVDLTLNLFTGSLEEKLAGQARFADDAPLLAHGLMHRVAQPEDPHRSFLSEGLQLDPQIVRLFLGQSGLDGSLTRFASLVDPAGSLSDLPLPTGDAQALLALGQRARQAPQALHLHFSGPAGSGKRATAEALAAELGMRFLVLEALPDPVSGTDPNILLKRLLLAARTEDALLYLAGIDGPTVEKHSPLSHALRTSLAAFDGITVLSAMEGLGGLHIEDAAGRPFSVAFSLPDAVGRAACWRRSLQGADIVAAEDDLNLVAGRFRLSPGQIHAAAQAAIRRPFWRAAQAGEAWPGEAVPSRSDLLAAAREQSGRDLRALAIKIDPVNTWDDIVLPEDVVAQLREICRRVVHHERVFSDWGFAKKLTLGRGVTALFSGPSGTGKTMAAEVIAGELHVDLYRIDLSGVVSKYIGETEKNLDRVFRAAESANAILFFDEADALFGKRSEVRDSHDRYANIEISYLLQKMEQFEGVAILATNLRGNLDESFTRRLTFAVYFPFPDEEYRRRIWSRSWPAETPLTGDVDLDFLARQFSFSGGNIMNVILAATFLAAEDGDAVGATHLLHAIRREYQKMGKQLTPAELATFRNEAGR